MLAAAEAEAAPEELDFDFLPVLLDTAGEGTSGTVVEDEEEEEEDFGLNKKYLASSTKRFAAIQASHHC